MGQSRNPFEIKQYQINHSTKIILMSNELVGQQELILEGTARMKSILLVREYHMLVIIVINP